MTMSSPKRFRCRSDKLFITIIKEDEVLNDCPHTVISDMLISRLILLGLEREDVTYIRIAKEIAPTTNNVHFHAIIILNKKITINSATAFDFDIGGENIHPRIEGIRNLTHAIKYVSKEHDFIELGEIPDIIKKIEEKADPQRLIKIKKNALLTSDEVSEIELVDSGIINLADIERVAKARIIYRREKKERIMSQKREVYWDNTEHNWIGDFKPLIFWFYGETGSGKSSCCFKLVDSIGFLNKQTDLWISGASGLKWFEGYSAHPIVLIDDFRARDVAANWNLLLRILDRYPIKVEVKNSSVNWLPFVIIITCPVDPRTCFTWKKKTMEELTIDEMGFNPQARAEEIKQEWDSTEQLYRRISEIVEFKGITDEDPYGCGEQKFNDMLELMKDQLAFLEEVN